MMDEESLEAYFQNLESGFDDFLGEVSRSLSEPTEACGPESTDVWRYQVGGLLGEGAVKLVYEALDSKLNRPVALAYLKDLGDAEEVAAAFLREAEVTARLQHPHIMPIYDYGIDPISERPYFVMRLMPQEHLHTVIKRLQAGDPDTLERFPKNKLFDIFLKVCDAIAYAHERGVIHLDLKPDNIVVGAHGEVFVGDWGLARVVSEVTNETPYQRPLDAALLNHITLTGAVRGTPGFMAPEQIDDDLGPKSLRSDIFGLGALLYMLMVGEVPFNAAGVNTLLAMNIHGFGVTQRLRLKAARVPESVKAIIVKAMQANPAARYQSVDELIADVEAYRNGFATKAENPGLMRELLLLCGRHKSVTLLTVLLVLLAGFFHWQMRANAVAGRRLLTLYQSERAQSQAHFQELLPDRQFELKDKFRFMSAADAQRRCEEILKFFPDDLLARQLWVVSQFLHGKYRLVEAELAKPELQAWADILPVCQKARELSERPQGLQPEAAAELILSLARKRHFLSIQFTATLFEALPTDVAKSELLHRVLFKNPNVGKVSVSDGGRSVEVLSLEPLARLDWLGHLPITHLRIKVSKMANFTPRPLSGLRELTLDVAALDTLQGMIELEKLERVYLPDYCFHGWGVVSRLRNRGVKVQGIDQ